MLSALAREREQVVIDGFQTIESAYDSYFDVVTSNIPFGDTRIFDASFRKSDDPVRGQALKAVHNYFFIKGLDTLREGGILAFVTSAGVMDAPGNPEASEVGISVYDLTAKKSLYNYRAEKLSRPASTMKLLTAITALSRPEAAEPFRTEVWHDGVIEHDTLQGNLYVVGGFDPEFNSQSMDSLIEEVITFPFSVINGQVYGDVSMKDSLYWGSGWAWDDTPAGYQPYLSPLMFCKGTVQVSVVPSTVQGDTVSVSCQPLSSYYTVTNQTKTRTSSAGRFSFTRDWLTNGNNLLVSGNVTSIRKDDVNIYDSPRFFMHTFLERLRGKGITTPQSYGFAELPRDSVRVERMACWNTSVQKVLNQLMKESDNLNAEAFLCRLGAQATGKKQVAAEDGIVEIMKLIRRLGHDPKDYKIADGCGLSNYNYLSPALLVDFLKYAYISGEVTEEVVPWRSSRPCRP